MSKSDLIEMEGDVIEVMRNAFKIKLINGFIITAHLRGVLRQRNIKIFVGDRVKVEMSPYDLTKGRIVWRFNK